MKPKKAPPLLSEQSIPVYPSLVRRYGLVGAMLIQQVHFECFARGTSAHGYDWTRRSYDGWTTVIPVSAATVKRAIKELEDDGILISTNLNFNTRNQTKWYRLHYPCLLKMTKDPGQNDQATEVKMTQCVLEIPSEESIEMGVDYATQETPTMKIIKNPTGVKVTPKKATTSDAVLGALQQAHGAAGPAPDIKKAMVAVWRTVPKYNKEVGMVPVLTSKAQSQLAYIGKAIGPTAEAVLRHVISHWIAYTKFVESAKGIKTTPALPDIGFVQKFVTEAVSFHKASVQSTAPTKKPVKIAAPVTATPAPPPPAAHKDEEEQEASLDDVLAWKDKLK